MLIWLVRARLFGLLLLSCLNLLKFLWDIGIERHFDDLRMAENYFDCIRIVDENYFENWEVLSASFLYLKKKFWVFFGIEVKFEDCDECT